MAEGENPLATKTLLTIEQFDQVPMKEETLYELKDGEVVIMTEPMPRHNWVRDNIARLMGNFVEERKLGRVFLETGYQLSPETVRIPDFSFVSADRMHEIDLDKRIQGAPALAIEVVAPTDLAADLRPQVKQHLAAGARAVWVIYPGTREVEIFRAHGGSLVRHEQESLEDPDLFPGHSIELESVFAVS